MLEPETIAQALMGGLLAVVGYLLKQVLHRLDKLEERSSINAGRLIRIETRLGLPAANHWEESQ